MINTESSGAAKLQDDTENLKTELDRLVTDVEELRSKLGAKQAQMEDLNKTLRLLQEWLQEAESKANRSEIPLNDLSEKKAFLERIKSLQKEVNNHSEIINKAKAKASDAGDNQLEACISRYSALQDLLAETISEIEGQVSEHEQYKKAYIAAAEWLRRTRVEVQQCGDPHGEREETVKKEARVSAIIGMLYLQNIFISKFSSETLSEGRQLIDNANNLSEAPISNSGPEGKDVIKQELNQLKTDWESVNFMCTDSHKTLNKCLNCWSDFNETYNDMEEWLKECKHRTELESAKGNQVTPDDLQVC